MAAARTESLGSEAWVEDSTLIVMDEFTPKSITARPALAFRQAIQMTSKDC